MHGDSQCARARVLQASSIPAGFTYDTILVGGSAPGVVKRVKSLGENLLTRGGKGTTSTQDDIVSTRLGYYTDNGTPACGLLEDGSCQQHTALRLPSCPASAVAAVVHSPRS